MEPRYLDNAKERVYALYMGLTMEEFEQLDYAEGDETSNDGTVYYHWIQLRSGNSPAIVERIRHRDGDRIRFPSHLFQAPEDWDRRQSITFNMDGLSSRCECRGYETTPFAGQCCRASRSLKCRHLASQQADARDCWPGDDEYKQTCAEVETEVGRYLEKSKRLNIDLTASDCRNPTSL